MVKVVLDTNVIISAIIFGGHPRTILENVIRHGLLEYHSCPLHKNIFLYP